MGVPAAGTTTRQVHGDDQNVRLHLFNDIRQVRFVLHLAHDLDIGLVGDRSQHQFPHQPRMICYQYTNSFHGTTPAPSIGRAACKHKVQKRSTEESLGKTRTVLEGTIGEVLMQIQPVPVPVLIQTEADDDAAPQREPVLNSNTVTL